MSKLQWHLDSYPSKKLPGLAWVATAPLNGGAIQVHHGRSVEIRDNWLVEGCWDAPFEQGGFHKSENFFGSGIRITGEGVFFCSSMALVDRLIYARYQDQLIVSNSLILLLAVTDAKLDLEHDYRNECHGILKGILEYPREFRIIHPVIESFFQVFSSNLILDIDGLRQIPSSQPVNIDNYDHYLSLLKSSLNAIAENLRSKHRQQPMTVYSTLSSGYDSTAVTCLATDIGATTCFSTTPGDTRKSRKLEDGKRIADLLGMESILLSPEDKDVSENEAFFLAPTYDGSEVIFDQMSRFIEEQNQPAVVMTGYHGDKIWDRSTKGIHLQDAIIRGDTSGINLSEIRLKAGFINLAVPFMYSRSARDIVGIASLPEMQAWQTNNSYDRPVPRRIAELHGIPGNWFGQKKKAVLSYYSKPVNHRLRQAFMRFLKEEAGVSFIALQLYEASELFDHFHLKILSKLKPDRGIKSIPWSLRRFLFRKELDLRRLMFVWSCSYLSERMNLRDVPFRFNRKT